MWEAEGQGLQQGVGAGSGRKPTLEWGDGCGLVGEAGLPRALPQFTWPRVSGYRPSCARGPYVTDYPDRRIWHAEQSHMEPGGHGGVLGRERTDRKQSWGGGRIFAGEETTDTRTNERWGAVWKLPEPEARTKLVKTCGDGNEAPQPPVPKKRASQTAGRRKGRRPMFLSFAKIHFDFAGEAQKFVIQLLMQFSKFLSLKMSLERNMKTCVI